MSIKSGVSAISNEVLGDVQNEAEAVIKAAETKAKETLSAAKHEADQKYREQLNQAKTKAIAERRKIASVTEVEMRNRLLQTKEDLVDIAFQQAVDKLKSFTETKEYETYLLKHIEDAARKIGKKNLIIQINPRDAQWLTEDKVKPLAKKLQVELEISKSTEQFIGGCIIQTSDGKIIYNSTIDNRLEELKPTMRVEVAKILFGEA
jgi:V/A-type H+/Na+-transporting ATPase subunit E